MDPAVTTSASTGSDLVEPDDEPLPGIQQMAAGIILAALVGIGVVFLVGIASWVNSSLVLLVAAPVKEDLVYDGPVDIGEHLMIRDWQNSDGSIMIEIVLDNEQLQAFVQQTASGALGEHDSIEDCDLYPTSRETSVSIISLAEVEERVNLYADRAIEWKVSNCTGFRPLFEPPPDAL